MRKTGLQAAIEWVQDQMLTLEAVRPMAAPDYLEPKAEVFPFFATYAGEGRWEPVSAEMSKGLVSIIIELHVEMKILPRAVKEAMKYVEIAPRKILADTTLGETVSTFEAIDFSGLIGMKYGSVDTIGFRWTIRNIKIQNQEV